MKELAGLPFEEALFQQYVARRRVVRYGEGDYLTSRSASADKAPRRPLPVFLLALRAKVASWRALPETTFVHALVTEYRPGTPIGWHRDAPHFETVVGISLAGAARMRFRPYRTPKGGKAAFELALAPRSAYAMTGKIRWQWEHHIPPTRELRYSVTFRTFRDQPA